MAELAEPGVGKSGFAGAESALPEADWAAAIAAQPPSSKEPMEGPAQGLFLTFRDRALERAYLQFEYERSKRVIVVGLFIGAAILIAFFWIDPLITPQEHVAAVTGTRLLMLVPAALVGLVGSILIKDVRFWIPLVAITDLIGGLRPSVLLFNTDGALYSLLTSGIWNIIVVAFFICGLPLRWSAPICLLFGSVFAVSSLLVHAPMKDFAHFAVNFAMVFVFSAAATYRYERATRLQFVAQGMAQILAERRLTTEADRRKWLEVIAAFLRHELNNAMTAISSSVDLAERALDRAKLAKFLGRARRSTLYMRRLLAQVADATSLESALVQRSFERCNLSALVRDRVLDFEEDHALTFEASIEENQFVQGNPDALNQLLDKLLNNAMEHGTPGVAIGVELSASAGACTLTISNQGDTLPEDVERLFRPFVSSKAHRSQGANLGLGLFVARTIATHHGGSLLAAPLRDGRVGARFTLGLPAAADQ